MVQYAHMKMTLGGIQFASVIRVNASIERTFDLFSDPKQWRNWMVGVKRVYRVEGEMQSPGCVTKLVLEDGIKKITILQELIEWERPKKLVVLVSHQHYTCHMTIQFIKQGGRTKVICNNAVRWTHLGYILVGWFFGVLMRKNQLTEWDRFKQYCESHSNYDEPKT